MTPEDLSQSLHIGEQIARSIAPAFVLTFVLLIFAASGVWVTVRRQRLWIEKRLSAVEGALTKCEEQHRIFQARGARRTSLLLQLMGFAENLAHHMRRDDDIRRLAEIRMKVEALLVEEADEALAESVS